MSEPKPETAGWDEAAQLVKSRRHAADLSFENVNRVAQILHNEFSAPNSTWASLSDAEHIRWKASSTRVLRQVAGDEEWSPR